ncbi:MMPL family transporter [Streptomyces daliensis]
MRPDGGPPGPGSGSARRARRRAWGVAGLVAVVTVLCALVAGGTWDRLVSGGFDASGTEAVRAESHVAERFHAGPPHLTLLARTGKDGREDGRGVDAPGAVRDGRELTERLRDAPGVLSAHSYWTTGDRTQRADDGDAALVTAVLSGSDAERTETARTLVTQLTGTQGELEVGATGTAWTAVQSTDGSEHDLVRAELLTAPLVFVVLVFAFRSLVAAFLPVVVAAVASVVTLALLRPLSSAMSLSVFSANLTTALGFGLAVDYCLFLLTRYRHEIAQGLAPPDAVAVCLRTAGRAVGFSVATIALAMAALFVFPVGFLRSMACAGIVVTVCAGLVALILLPALLLLLGAYLERWDPAAWLLPRGGAAGSGGDPWESSPGWRRAARAVCRRPVAWGATALAALCLLATPVAHLALGPIDERTLPRSAESHAVVEEIRDGFTGASGTTAVVVLPHLKRAGADELGDYARRLSTAGAVTEVTASTGDRYREGRRTAEARSATGSGTGPGAEGAWLSLHVDASPESDTAADTVREVRDAPVAHTAWVGGDAARFADTQRELGDALGAAAALIGTATALLLFLFTGSVLIPVKAVLVGALSLGACFGAVVWVFQDGHAAGALGVSAQTGTVDACMLLLVFCVAFGLSMDYEVFLLSRIQEEYRRTDDNRLAVERGIEQTGRLVTVAALAVAIAMAALATSGITLLKLLGFGLALAVVVDATLVRAVLVPAAMRLAGRASWWAPRPLRWLHGRFGLREEEAGAGPGRGGDGPRPGPVPGSGPGPTG